MKARDLLKNAVESYRNEVSGQGVEIKVPELGLDFFVFPSQPAEEVYFLRDMETLYHYKPQAIILIAARAKKADGSSLLDNDKERDNFVEILMNNTPSAFTVEVAQRVIQEITDAYPSTNVEEAGNGSEETVSSDSTST